MTTATHLPTLDLPTRSTHARALAVGAGAALAEASWPAGATCGPSWRWSG
jgi:hypothetical protein